MPSPVPQMTIGRTVHYVMPGGEHRPAMVVQVWDDPGSYPLGVCNLVVFLDGTNDRQVPYGTSGDLVMWATSVYYNDTKTPYTWHWPERA